VIIALQRREYEENSPECIGRAFNHPCAATESHVLKTCEEITVVLRN
jgi:hypothetical protein